MEAALTQSVFPKPARSWAELADQLDAAGYFSMLDPKVVPSAKSEIVDTEWYDAWERFDFWLPADEERLAERGVAEAMEDDYSDLFAMYSIPPPVVEELGQDLDYLVRYRGQIFTVANAESFESGGDWGWCHATRITQLIVNDHLARHGVRDRVYLINGGNDGLFVLMTPECQRLITQSGLVQDPYESPRIAECDEYFVP